MTTLPKFRIGNLEVNLIQGGMGVGVSGKNLASAVADCGGAGIIASVALGLLNKYPGTYKEANKQALHDEIKAARKMSNGVIGVNIMRALTDYEELVKVAAEENVDLIISGAGLSKNLPALIGDKPIALVPIVSSERAARLMTGAWVRYGKVPDAFVVEGPLAGGHLGYDYDSLVNGTAPKLEDIVKEVISFANEINRPVIVAGGIYTGQDLRYFIEKIGATGVQMATRFVTTKECDADDKFKQAYLDATEKDIQIIKSPVGMPGRAIMNDFLRKAMNDEKEKFACRYRCLTSCKPQESLYCIADALINAQKGNLERGFAFAGANAHRATKETCLDEKGEFISVKTLMQRLSDEYNS